jgi:HSP20 family protein
MSRTSTGRAVEPTTTEAPATAGSAWSDWFDHWPEMFARRWPEAFRGMTMPTMPFGGGMFRMEHLTEADGTVVIRAELPGIDPAEDVKIAIEDGRLTISGERHEHHETEDTHGYRSEFQYGSFERTVRLPAGARFDDVVATYRDGILEVRVPVDAEGPAVRHVPVST